MGDGRKYYCMCDSNCKYETMTKEQILAAIAQAMETGVVGDPDTGFVSKVQEGNRRDHVTFWVGTKAQYNALQNIETNCMYIITDDTTEDDINTALTGMQNTIDGLTLATSNATLLAAGAYASDRTNKITFTLDKDNSLCGGDNLRTCELNVKKAAYVKSLGIVFYQYELKISGTMEEMERLIFKRSGGYSPASVTTDVVEVPLTVRHHTDMIDIQFYEAYETIGTESLPIMGWYFCSGE